MRDGIAGQVLTRRRACLAQRPAGATDGDVCLMSPRGLTIDGVSIREHDTTATGTVTMTTTTLHLCFTFTFGSFLRCRPRHFTSSTGWNGRSLQAAGRSEGYTCRYLHFITVMAMMASMGVREVWCSGREGMCTTRAWGQGRSRGCVRGFVGACA